LFAAKHLGGFGGIPARDIGDFSEIFSKKAVVLTYRKISGLGNAMMYIRTHVYADLLSVKRTLARTSRTEKKE
jgi:hypothetical protein